MESVLIFIGLNFPWFDAAGNYTRRKETFWPGFFAYLKKESLSNRGPQKRWSIRL